MTRGELGKLWRMAAAMECDLVEARRDKGKKFFTLSVGDGERTVYFRLVRLEDSLWLGKRAIEGALEEVGKLRAIRGY